MAKLGKLHALGPLTERPAERLVQRDMPQEMLPLNFEGVVVLLAVGDFFPALEKVDGLRDVGIPDGARSLLERLRPRLAQAGDAASARAVDLDGQQIVATDADAPA